MQNQSRKIDLKQPLSLRGWHHLQACFPGLVPYSFNFQVVRGLKRSTLEITQLSSRTCSDPPLYTSCWSSLILQKAHGGGHTHQLFTTVGGIIVPRFSHNCANLEGDRQQAKHLQLLAKTNRERRPFRPKCVRLQLF